MDEKQVIEQVQRDLTEIALELEEAARGARKAAGCCLHDRDAAWVQVHHLFARLDHANHVIKRFKDEIEDATRRGVRRKAETTPVLPTI